MHELSLILQRNILGVCLEVYGRGEGVSDEATEDEHSLWGWTVIA